MTKSRQDAWSHEDDLLLAETVLRHIREGGTQLNAFEEVGDHLNRTSAACGFRWNAEVRNRYVKAIDLAKRQRKEKKRRLAKVQAKEPNQPEISNQSFSTPQWETQVGNLSIEDYTEEDHEDVHADNPQDHKMNTAQTDVTLDTVIHFLTRLKQEYDSVNQSQATISELELNNNTLQDQVANLTKQLNNAQDEMNTIKEDYQIFMQIMDRARKMTVLEDQGTLHAPAFRMDKNGNLEQIVQSSSQ